MPRRRAPTLTENFSPNTVRRAVRLLACGWVLAWVYWLGWGPSALLGLVGWCLAIAGYACLMSYFPGALLRCLLFPVPVILTFVKFRSAVSFSTVAVSSPALDLVIFLTFLLLAWDTYEVVRLAESFAAHVPDSSHAWNRKAVLAGFFLSSIIIHIDTSTLITERVFAHLVMTLLSYAGILITFLTGLKNLNRAYRILDSLDAGWSQMKASEEERRG